MTNRYNIAHGIKPEPTAEDYALHREFALRMNRARCANEKKRAEEVERKRIERANRRKSHG